jgi:DNA-binding LacI/PurR family transcriptional regulator
MIASTLRLASTVACVSVRDSRLNRFKNQAALLSINSQFIVNLFVSGCRRANLLRMSRNNREKVKTDSGPVPSSGRPVSLKFLAEHLGLSRATISVVLNDAPVAKGISPQTRERVLCAAEKFNYHPNFFARCLNHKRSYLIGVISPDLAEGYDSALLAGIQSQLLASGFLYFVASHQWCDDLIEKLPGMLIERGAEGIIFINTRLAKRLAVPAVNIGGRKSLAGVTNIVVDNDHGVRLALEHLVELGHQRIAFFKGHAGSIDTEERWQAILKNSARLGIRVDPRLTVQLERLSGTAISAIEEGYRAAMKLMNASREFTALFAFNDMSALGAVNAFRDAGLALPDQLSIVGFDDVTAACTAFPPLTTIRQPLREMGEIATTRLLERIKDESLPAERVIVKPELVVRGSTAIARELAASSGTRS